MPSRRTPQSYGKGVHEDNDLVQKGLPCESPLCGSSDALALYSDGHRFCYSCGRTFRDSHTGSPTVTSPPTKEAPAEVAQVMASGAIRAIPSRKLTQATCQKFDYRVRVSPSGEKQQLAIYRDAHGTPVGVKLRGEDKEFAWVGKAKDQLFGRHLWGSGGKRVVISEGEIDCLSISQAQDNQWPVVSLPNGAQNAAKAVAANLEWLNSFDEVVLGFDMDEQGRTACLECAPLLAPGKAKIAKWSEKDANAMLMEGKAADIIKALWNAEDYRPDGIIDARELTARCLTPTEYGLPWPWKFMTEWTYGRRRGEDYLFGAGTGLGKTDFLTEVIACDLQGRTLYGERYQAQPWGVFAYEAGAATTKKMIAGKIARRRFHIPDAEWTQAELAQTLADMDGPMWDAGGKLYLNDSMGLADWDAVMDRTRYLNRAFGIRHFLVDTVGALVTESEDERKDLDRIALQWANLMVELNAFGYMISHLTRPSMGPSHEEGGHTSLKQFRGSNGLVMYHWEIFGLERDQQADDPMDRCTTTVRVLKDRFTGNSTGKTSPLVYDQLTGTLDTINLGTGYNDEPV